MTKDKRVKKRTVTDDIMEIEFRLDPLEDCVESLISIDARKRIKKLEEMVNNYEQKFQNMHATLNSIREEVATTEKTLKHNTYAVERYHEDITKNIEEFYEKHREDDKGIIELHRKSINIMRGQLENHEDYFKNLEKFIKKLKILEKKLKILEESVGYSANITDDSENNNGIMSKLKKFWMFLGR
jgi:tetrahydromethanopterin S-methyltransferase subunit B